MSQKSKSTTQSSKKTINDVELTANNTQVRNKRVSPLPSPENLESDQSNQPPLTRDERFYNQYATKKTFSNGFLNIALLANNVGQLKLLLSDGIIDTKQTQWWISIVLVSFSLSAQIAIMIILGYLANNNLSNKRKKSYINVMNNLTLVLTGLVFFINIILNILIQLDFSNLSKPATQNSETTTTIPSSLWSGADPASIK